MHCTRERFYEVVRSQQVSVIIDRCRQLVAAGDIKGYAAEKKKLPCFIFQATMTPNHGRKGTLPLGLWRLQAAARLNGLVMIDVDHLERDPLDVFNEIPSHWFDMNSCPYAILLAHRTPSGHGLRLVCTADPRRGTLADNQRYIATCLGLTCDEAVKNADRTSFAVKESDIFYINDAIFTYENEEFKTLYSLRPKPTPTPSRGEGSSDTLSSDDPQAVATPLPSAPALLACYRRDARRGGEGVGSVTSSDGNGTDEHSMRGDNTDPTPAPPLEGRGAAAHEFGGVPTPLEGRGAAAHESPQCNQSPLPSGKATGSCVPLVASQQSWSGRASLGNGEGGGSEVGLSFGGVPAQLIIDKWIEERGVPAEGTRHLTMLRLAGDLRYICENDPARLKQWVMMAPFVQDIVRERGEDEVTHACEDVCDRKLYMSIPKNFNAILEKLGATKALPLGAAGGGLRGDGDGSYPLRGDREGSFWHRLKPLLAPPYDVACSLTEDENKMGAVFAAGAMYCTLMTRCWYEHFDGMEQRLNPQVYIIGMPAAGKSFADKLDNIIMGPMKAADAIGREAEAEYKRKLKERQTSSKAAKGEPLKKPEVMIRYCPSKTSNHVLFHRLENAREMVDGKEMHLHIYTFDSELDANTAAQRGGSWIDKHDIELKAFHNECTGVDYSNPDSSNGIFPVYYNTVCTGTPLSLQRKINIRNVNDGLCSRIAFFKMKDDGFHMIARGSRLRLHDQECKIKQWAFRFDSMKGELKIGRLVDHVYNLCQEATWTAEASGDRVLDMLRKRAVFYAIWFTIPRIYARQWKQYEKTGEVEVDDSDLQFATLIYDAVLYWQDRLFGRMLEDSWQNAENDDKPRLRRTVNDEVFARLPQEFDTKAVIDMMKVSKGGASAQLRRWLAAGMLERTSHGKYRKKGATA